MSEVFDIEILRHALVKAVERYDAGVYEGSLEAYAPELLEAFTRLEQAEARVKLLESGIVSELVVTSVHSARAIGATVSGIADQLLKLGYDGLTERLEQAEHERVKLRNRLDTMRRQRDGYRNQLRKAQTNQGENNA